MSQPNQKPLNHTTPTKVSVITGAAHRLGAATARALHSASFNVIIHYNQSQDAAKTLAQELNQIRPNSADIIQANLNTVSDIQKLAEQAKAKWQRIDLLVNNASQFYSTEVGESNEQQWDDLFNCNAKAPFFLSQALAPSLADTKGVIINILDIYSERPLHHSPIYSMAKAALRMMTLSLAQELAPKIRVNGVSPGAILWPTKEQDNIEKQQQIIQKVPLNRTGEPKDIADAILFLATQAPYITGQIITVDGGRSATI